MQSNVIYSYNIKYNIIFKKNLINKNVQFQYKKKKQLLMNKYNL